MKKNKILIVEDELIVAEDLHNNLESMGYEVTSVETTGEEAIASVRRNIPDCVMMDITLRGKISGIETARTIKNEFDVPIIFLTAHTDRGNMDAAKITEPYGYLLKPFQDKDVLMTIETAIYKHGMETRLRDNEKKFRSIVENSHAGICIIKTDGEIDYINNRLVDLLGYKNIDLPSQDFLFYFNNNDKPKIQNYLDDPENFEISNGVELNILTPDKTAKCLELRGSVIHDDDGTTKLLMQFLDITQRRESEQKMQMLAHALRSTNECVSVSDLDNKFVFTNYAFQKTYGFTNEETLGKNLSIIRSKTNPSNLDEDIYKKTIEGGWSGELINCKKDGTEFPIFLSTSIIRDDENKPVAFVGVARDITQEKELDEKMYQRQKLESIGKLAGGVAHDFNNLLAIINGYTELVMSKVKDNPVIISFLKEIEHAGGKAADLTRQLLTFSRKQVIKPQIVNINDTLNRFSKMLRRLIGEDVELKLNLGEKVSAIKADPGQLEQLIMNLVINSRDAIHENKEAKQKTITVSTSHFRIDEHFTESHHEDLVPGNYVMISVLDSGFGMDEEVREHIFDPFFTTKEKGKGTGLGLSTVYGIVQQNKGLINVYSEIGQGTEFKIYWPCIIQDEDRNKDEESSAIHKGSETILLVEDDPKVKELHQNIISSLGYNVLASDNGKKALDVLKEHHKKVNMILSDVVMPEMDGIEFGREVNEEYPKMKILFTSGYSDEHVAMQKILKSGGDFIPKPFSISDISKKIREILDK